MKISKTFIKLFIAIKIVKFLVSYVMGFTYLWYIKYLLLFFRSQNRKAKSGLAEFDKKYQKGIKLQLCLFWVPHLSHYLSIYLSTSLYIYLYLYIQMKKRETEMTSYLSFLYKCTNFILCLYFHQKILLTREKVNQFISVKEQNQFIYPLTHVSESI